MSSFQAMAIIHLPFGRFKGGFPGVGKHWQSLWPKGPVGTCLPVNGSQRPEAKQRSELSRLEGEVMRGGGRGESKGCTWGWTSLKR